MALDEASASNAHSEKIGWTRSYCSKSTARTPGLQLLNHAMPEKDWLHLIMANQGRLVVANMPNQQRWVKANNVKPEKIGCS